MRGPALFHPGRAPTMGVPAMGETRTRVQRVTAMAGRMSEAELDSGVRRILADLKKRGRPVLAYHPWSSKHALTAAGMSAGVWYPADLLDGTIARELAALAGMGGASR